MTELKTVGELYDPAMNVQTEQEAQEYLAFLIEYYLSVTNWDRAEAQRISLHNIGYYTGYCSPEIANRVMRLFNTQHPVFGAHRPDVD